MNSKQLVQALRKRRRELKTTQQSLGTVLGLGNSYISLMESGKRDIKLKYFVEACKLLKLDIIVMERDNE